MEVERLRNLALNWKSEPFQHFYAENIFSDEFYKKMLLNLPDLSRYRQYGLYKNRYLYDITPADSFWNGVKEIFEELHGKRIRVQLCKDLPGYSIGPHTDGKKETHTYLFYLAKDDSRPDLGTAVYVPKDKTFTCDGTKHHSREGFDLLFTAPYKPNSAFGFIRSDNSFHGVEPTDKERDLIQVSVWR